MPKFNKYKKNLIGKWFRSLPEKCFKIDGDKIICTTCDKEIPCDKKFQLQQHIVTSLHRRSKASNDNNDENAHNSSNTSSNLSDSSNNEFKSDLCEALVAGNIPWNVLSNATFNNFLKKYTGQPIPDESTLRKNYLDKCYQESIKKIRDSIKEESIWISVDETTDKQGRYVANLIVGILSENEFSDSFLLSCKQLEQVNNATIARFVNDSIRILWPHGNESKVLLLLTDAAAYMIKAGKNLKVFYPNLIHITCLAHGLNLIAEKVRTSFPVANSFISCVKKIFVKAPLRVKLYKQIVNKELPPEPIITRWGTWLKAASFYADNMDRITEVLEALNPEDAESIKLAKELIKNPELHRDFIYIKSNFERVGEIITSLEAKGQPLLNSIKLFKEAENIVHNITGDIGIELKEKLEAILIRNPDFNIILKINNIINRDAEDLSGLKPVTNENIIKYKFAPITSCDVERSFSAYKMVFGEKRQRLSINNLEKMLVVYCNTNYRK